MVRRRWQCLQETRAGELVLRGEQGSGGGSPVCACGLCLPVQEIMRSSKYLSAACGVMSTGVFHSWWLASA